MPRSTGAVRVARLQDLEPTEGDKTMIAVQVVKKFYEYFGQGKLEDALALLADDVKWELAGPRAIPYFGSYRGRSEVKRFFDKLLEVEDVLEFSPTEFIASDEKVAVVGRERCRSKVTNKEFSVQ